MSQELKFRIISAIVLVAAIVLLLFQANETVLFYSIGLFVAIGAWEWVGLAKISSFVINIIFIILVVVLSIVVITYNVYYWLYITGIWWFFWLFILPLFPTKTIWMFNTKTIVLLSGLLVLVGFWQAIYYWHNDRLQILLLILIIASADTGAYFIGKFCGKTPLACNISPKKTIEGLFGGLGLALLSSSIFIYFLQDFCWQYFIIIILVVIFSIVGDLSISCYKRQANLKDSGKILPGHGGILDRIDGFLAATPIFTIFWLLLF